jgi:DAACS family dicarboxylate/amino acid:cation (Na+ or H+) symporter
MKLYAAVALGLILGLLLGLVASVSGSPALLAFAEGIEPIGKAFVDLLKMVVIPLVVAIIFLGVAGLGDLRRLGKMGSLTLLFFAATSALGVLIGMGVMQLLMPLASDAAAQAVAGPAAEAPVFPGPIEFLLSLIPSNPFQVAAEGALLPLIVFTILFAAAAGALPRPDRDRLLDLAGSITAALIKLVHWIIWLAPIGVFALAAPVTARAGWAMLQSLGAFILAVLLGLLLFVAVVYMPAIRFLGGMPVGKFLKGSLNPIIIALSTSSTAATVPAMIEASDEELMVSRPVTSFVIPLGAGVGRMGTALFQGAGIVFLAWLFGVPLAVTGIGAAVLATFIVSFTVAGIPAGGVVSLAPALDQVGIPLDGMGVLLGVDRIPDMARTATNVTGILAAAVVVDRLVGTPEPAGEVEEVAVA